ncbi:MAG: hypothetical protein JSV74_07360 [Dehalococcoidia bacterium]|nr:MAG: hypothetical protein JSV74_07360 [Dehalococcoidia bacterium]
MTDIFKIGDGVLYHTENQEPHAGEIKDITYNQDGKQKEYLVRLKDGQMVTCNIDQIAHYDLEKL